MAGALLTIVFYAVMLLFLAGLINRAVIYVRGAANVSWDAALQVRESPLLTAYMLMDILFLGRLLKANPLIWIWEWLFHVSFGLVLLRHLRYFLNPVPGWVFAVQPLGVIAGYTLPLSLIVVLFMKLFSEKGYFSSYNFYLIAQLLAIGATGLLMNTLIKTDLVGIKHFSMGIVTFRPEVVPCSYSFLLHFVCFMLFILSLPSHIFTAPISMMEARKRDEALELVIHER